MKRRDFLQVASCAVAAAAMAPRGFANSGSERIDAAWYRRSRRFAKLKVGKMAYVEHGHGPAALFVHGFPLNGFQWRGALEKLHRRRRCVAPDLMGMGYTQTAIGHPISSATQATMLAMLLDSLHIDAVDLVANDSGGIVAQLFLARYPQRVRTLLLTNCDVDENNPPSPLSPGIEQAKNGTFVDQFVIPQLNDKNFTRSPNGMGGQAFTYPEKLSDETIEIYFRPLVETPLRRLQVNEYFASMGTNVLVAVREDLRRWKGPARIVWGVKDSLFDEKWAEWLDKTLPGSRGVRRVEEGKLFFPEEMPELIADEAMKLWDVKR